MEGGYPTPTCTQSQRQADHGAISVSQGRSLKAPFTARGESSEPSQEGRGGLLQSAYDFFRNLRTPSPFQAGPNNDDSLPLPSSPSPIPPMAPRRGRSRTNRTATSAATILVPNTPVEENADNGLDILPGIEEEDNASNIPAQTRSQQLARLRTSQFNLTGQLRDSTALVERLRTREDIANIERDRAYVDRNVARAEMEVVRTERDAERGDRLAAVLKYKALMVLVFLYTVYRWLLYRAEFEYIWERTMVELGLEKRD